MIEGLLQKTKIERWSVDDDSEITSGDVIEVCVDGHWIQTRIEHDGKEYYSVIPGIHLYEGMKVRIKP
jgi:hypothetical protein